MPFRAVFPGIQEYVLPIPEIDILIAPEHRAKQIKRAKEIFCEQLLPISMRGCSLMWFVPPWFKYAALNSTTSDEFVRHLMSWGAVFGSRCSATSRHIVSSTLFRTENWFVEINASDFDRVINHQGWRIPASVKAQKPSRPEFMACLEPSPTTHPTPNTDWGWKAPGRLQGSFALIKVEVLKRFGKMPSATD